MMYSCLRADVDETKFQRFLEILVRRFSRRRSIQVPRLVNYSIFQRTLTLKKNACLVFIIKPVKYMYIFTGKRKKIHVLCWGRKKVVKTTIGTIIINRKVFPSATGTLKNLTIKFRVNNPGGWMISGTFVKLLEEVNRRK